MTRFLLGIDTGGTFTDAVIYDEVTSSVMAKAKSPTTHDDLIIGILGAIDGVLGAVAAPSIELVSLSTTLATNALVEGRGRPVGSIVIGFEPDVLQCAGLGDAVGRDPVAFVRGGHSSYGHELAPLDTDGLARAISDFDDRVDAWSVTSKFAVRNYDHELATKAMLVELTGKPVSCSHELSARLNGPKRAVTSTLNARLIAIVDELIDVAQQALRDRGIKAPLMVVRGDGSLVSAAFARDRPIETILSGPAASLVGAAHLTDLRDALVADIGGTTTDVAVLRDGRPTTDPDGASVGGHRTMVHAVAMHAFGLGGDSHVALNNDFRPSIIIGPRRVIPIADLAARHGGSPLLLRCTNPLVAIRTLRPPPPGLSRTEQTLLESVHAGPDLVEDIAPSSVDRAALGRLVDRGLVQLSGFTPTDASHILGVAARYDTTASRVAAERLAARLDTDAETFAHATIDEFTNRLADALLRTALSHDGIDPATVDLPAIRLARRGHAGAARISVGLELPIVGLGAPANLYCPAVAAALSTTVVVPEHADVANAIGAVVGRVQISRSVLIVSPALNRFLVHLGHEPVECDDVSVARSTAESFLRGGGRGRHGGRRRRRVRVCTELGGTLC